MGWITGIAERIQVPDARTADSHVVGGSQCLGRRQLVGEHHGRYDVVKACIEILFRHLGVFHIHEGMFVAYAHFGSHLLPFQHVVSVGSQNVLRLLEIVGQVIVHLIFTVVFLEILALTLVVSQDVLGTEVDVVHIRNGIGVIQLEGMLIGTGIVVIVLVAEVVWIVLDLLVFSIRLAIVRRAVVSVGECQIFPFLLEGMLVVEVGANASK